MHAKPRQPFRYQGCPSSKGLVAAWVMPEGCGSITRDYSGYSNHGTLTNMDLANDWILSSGGPTINFNGTSASVIMNDRPSLKVIGSVSIAVFFRHTGVVNIDYLISKYGYNIFVNNDKLYFETRAADNLSWDSPTPSSPVYTRGDWISGVCIFDAAAEVKQVWANGYAGTPVSKTDGFCGGVSGTNLRLGAWQSGGQYFPGQISIAAIWDRALTHSEILAFHVDPFHLFRPSRSLVLT